MILFTCKVCGTELHALQPNVLTECTHCGEMLCVPMISDETQQNLFNQSAMLLCRGEWESAMVILEQLIAKGETDAEIYFAMAMCRYGVRYVKDPFSGRYCLTVNGMNPISILQDADFVQALSKAAPDCKEEYEKCGRLIDGIISRAGELPGTDVFLNTAAFSPVAAELRENLTRAGYRVFITPDSLQGAGEVECVAALRSAGMMLVLGETPEDFADPRVENLYRRYMLRLAQNRKANLSCAAPREAANYLPEELMMYPLMETDEAGFAPDFLRSVNRIFGKQMEVRQGSYTRQLLQQAFYELENGEFDAAEKRLDQALLRDPMNGEAYLGKLMVDVRVRTKEELKELDEPLEREIHYQLAVRYMDQGQLEQMEEIRSVVWDNYSVVQAKAVRKYFDEHWNIEPLKQAMMRIKAYENKWESMNYSEKSYEEIDEKLKSAGIGNIVRNIEEMLEKEMGCVPDSIIEPYRKLLTQGNDLIQEQERKNAALLRRYRSEKDAAGREQQKQEEMKKKKKWKKWKKALLIIGAIVVAVYLIPLIFFLIITVLNNAW